MYLMLKHLIHHKRYNSLFNGCAIKQAQFQLSRDWNLRSRKALFRWIRCYLGM